MTIKPRVSATPREPQQARAVSTTWIPVSSELPDTDTTVMVHMPKAESEPVWFGFYDAGTGFWHDTDGSRFRYPVSHWAKFPEPPNS